MAKTKYWLGKAPTKCDTCDAPIEDAFVDGKTDRGPWAFMCLTCAVFGPGLGKFGPGLGQQYNKQPDTGRWQKSAG